MSKRTVLLVGLIIAGFCWTAFVNYEIGRQQASKVRADTVEVNVPVYFFHIHRQGKEIFRGYSLTKPTLDHACIKFNYDKDMICNFDAFRMDVKDVPAFMDNVTTEY